MHTWSLTPEEIASSLDSDVSHGISKEEANRRLESEGRNVLPTKGGPSPWHLLLSQFSSLIVWLLIAAAVIAGVLGEVIDSYAIIAIVILNAVLGFFQEFRAERSLEALQKLSTPRSKVIREGELVEISSEEIVAGDLLLLEAGATIPADGRIVSASYFRVDEASLTGESVPVNKKVIELEEGTPLPDRKNMVFRGTQVAAGKGYVLVTETGLSTEIGKIASELMVKKKQEQTPLQKQLNRLGRKLVYICLAVVVVVFGLGLFRQEGVVEMLLVSLSLAVAAIPEGLPAAVTIALSIGVRKMADKQALIRRLSSVETLGSTTVICTDKTGTLTQNEMTVRAFWVGGTYFPVYGSGYVPEGEIDTSNGDLLLALKTGALCNSANLEEKDGVWRVVGDPTEGALLTAAAKGGLNRMQLDRAEPMMEEIPFDSTRKMMSMLRGGEEQTLYVKGAVGPLLECSRGMLINGKEVPLDREAIEEVNRQFASKSYRVLALAVRKGTAIAEEKDLLFIGLVAMIDPPRPEVVMAIRDCRKAGIRPVMVTGDHKDTAVAIAKELGLLDEKEIAIDGSELNEMSDEELLEKIDYVPVFSRISAAHKLRIIQVLQKKGEVTAMTGDGVNDAPAVQKADIGVSMGITGTDVTKSSSDMVILDDNFHSIAEAVRQGRGIYDNIVKFVSYLLSSNIAEILVIFIVLLLGLTGPAGEPFVALLPVQILWMNLVTDGFPAISLAMDPVDPRAMHRPPRPVKEEILNLRFISLVISIAVLVTAGAIIACFFGLETSVAKAQTMTFTMLIVLELIRVQMIRRQYRVPLFSNGYLMVALLSSFCLQIAVVYVPSFQKVFGTVALGMADWAVIGAVAFTLWWVGLLVTKIFYRDS